STYEERLLQYLEGNQIGEAQKCVVFLLVVGPKTFGLLKNLLTPNKLGETSFSDLLKVLRKYYVSMKNVIAERFQFCTPVQQVGETISEYIVYLKILPTTSNAPDPEISILKKTKKTMDNAPKDKTSYPEVGRKFPVLVIDAMEMTTTHSNVILRNFSTEIVQRKGILQELAGSKEHPMLQQVKTAEQWPGKTSSWLPSQYQQGSHQGTAAHHNLEKILYIKSDLRKYTSVFKAKEELVKGIKTKLWVSDKDVPKFCKLRPIPYALREAVNWQLKALEEKDIKFPIPHSKLVAPIVCSQTDVRIYGDYKITINPWSDVDRHPIPMLLDLFTRLAGGKKFTKLDLSQAYQQVALNDSSMPYLTINTQRSLYQYKQLLYGVASAPVVFQRTMDKVLQGLHGVIYYLDGILITGSTTELHLEKLDEYGLRVKKEKYRMTYLSHRTDAKGLHPVTEKTEAIAQAAVPTNTTELRLFLALVMVKNVKGHIVKQILKLFKSDCPLLHYDPTLSIILTYNASPVGFSAVILHRMSGGCKKLIALCLTLTKTERNYTQIRSIKYCIMFGVTKLHEYLYGRKFILVTDHKPLLKILGPKSGVSVLAAARLQKWSLILAAYQYEHGNADALSRLPMES
uniref:ribonuclease H n=1 Tax=Latimeria chalumnae TaxID=7897 RepID=H3AIK2_LATCH